MACEKTTKTLKCGVVVKTYKYSPSGKEEKLYYYRGMELAHLMSDGVLCFNSKYWRNKELKKELKDIFSLIRRRAKAKAVSEYMNI